MFTKYKRVARITAYKKETNWDAVYGVIGFIGFITFIILSN